MEWTKDKSTGLSIVCVYVFALLLFAADIAAPFLLELSNRLIPSDPSHGIYALITLYSASVFAWICLYLLWRLLQNLRGGLVFTPANIRLLRGISWCCAAVAAVFLLSMAYFLPYFVVAAAALFMMLIVRIVKNIFQQAADMKSDLDLTI
ncbi:MAG: DUF2975 domain-containing protein [Oscillospiraceae bacterium]|nr:DUF2975 domain-containing protein [Oscillospiraceae bacterium]